MYAFKSYLLRLVTFAVMANTKYQSKKKTVTIVTPLTNV